MCSDPWMEVLPVPAGPKVIMTIFIDSAKESEVRLAKAYGWVKGVTTNPALLAQAGVSPELALQRLAAIAIGPVFYQLVSQTAAEMLKEAQVARDIVGDSLVLKIPPTPAGFRYVADHATRLECCLTAIYGAAQAIVAREAGARHVAVYVNRASRLMGDGIGLVREIASVLAGSGTGIIAASIKSADEASAAVGAGAHHLTVPLDVLTAMTSHPLSMETIAGFQRDGLGVGLGFPKSPGGDDNGRD